MEREIKFRCWHPGHGRKVPAAMYYDTRPGECLKFLAEGQPVTIMQYTGNVDRDGVSIYHGDVLEVELTKFQDERGATARFWVDWNDTMWGQEWHWQHISGYECSTHIVDTDDTNQLLNVRVIGNVHANPELLK